MKKLLIATLAITALSASPVLAAAPGITEEGSITLGGTYADLSGQEAKANEYRALGSGGYGALELISLADGYYFDVDAKAVINDGDDSSSYATDNDVKVRGGQVGLFKYSLFYNEIPHNLTYGAKTFLKGADSATLTSPLVPASTVPNAANTAAYVSEFDYTIERTNLGGEVELSFSPSTFGLISYSRTNTEGTQPFNFTTALREIPAPVDYTADNLGFQLGYRTKELIAVFDAAISSFTNADETMYIGQIGAGAAGYAYLPPDNDFYRLGGSLTYRLPFWSTAFMAKASRSVQTSDFTLLTDTTVPAAVRGTEWEGRIRNDAFSTSITSAPTSNLGVKVYYNYLDTSNDGDKLNYSTAVSTSYNNPVARNDFRKQAAGVEGDYKFSAHTKLTGGYKYDRVERSAWADNATLVGASSPHAEKTEDHTVFAQLKHAFGETLHGKLRYEHMFRESDYPTTDLYATTNRMLYFRAFEAADKDMDVVKAELEFDPTENLALGLQYAFKMNNYTDSTLGVQDETRHEVYADATYTMGKARLNVYGEYERAETDAEFFAGNSYGSPLVNSGTYSYNFLWKSERQDDIYALGGRVEADLLSNLMFMVDYRFEDADGKNDISVSQAILQPYADVDDMDDYTKQILNAKLTYQATENWSVDLGYLYEKLKYSDEGYEDYTYIVGTNYLTGAYNDPDYEAQLVYLGMKYSF